jgi:hypothetical protein
MLKIDAFLAPEAARLWQTALDAAVERELVENDERSAAQLRADAATSIVRGVLDRGDLGNSRKARPHLTAVFDARDLPGVTDELIDLARAERQTYGRLSRTTLEALFCDSASSRVVTHGPSEILDVGRTTRTVTHAQWKALVVRDRHCQHPGCHTPPQHCEAHHLHHWEHGGPTNLDNLTLLCHHHHRQHHRTQARNRPQPQEQIPESRPTTPAAMPRERNARDPVP